MHKIVCEYLIFATPWSVQVEYKYWLAMMATSSTGLSMLLKCCQDQEQLPNAHGKIHLDLHLT